MSKPLVYTPSPTGIAFHHSDAFVRAVMGPVGSGKSTMCVIELFKRATEQAPDENGIRRTRGLVVRNTFAELKSTTIKTCERWWGGLGRFVYDSPIRFECKRALRDNTFVDFECLFLPLDRPEQVGKLRSLEITFAWINEASLVPRAALEAILGRVGRYPETVEETGYGPTWRGCFLDTNPCNEKHWFHDFFVKAKDTHIDKDGKKIVDFFQQPGGLVKVEDLEGNVTYEANPDAENLTALDGGSDYYTRQLVGAEEDYITTMLCGKFGANFAGKPVYGQYRDSEHFKDEPIRAVRGVPLIVGMDFGLNPAAAFTQMDATGTLNVIDELCGFDITFDEFLDELLLPRIAERYAGLQIRVIGDPSGSNRSALSVATVYDKLNQRGLACSPAVTNDFLMRRDAVAHFLTRRHALVLGKGCEYLRDGFRGGYHYAQFKGSTGFKKEPDKNEFSHVHDALQYAALYYQRGLAQPGRIRIRRQPGADAAPRKRYAYA